MSWQDFESRVKSLKDVRRSAHFEVRFSYRNPKRNIGAGTGGVRSSTLISCYIHALERLYSTMVNPPFSRPASLKKNPIAVYVFESSDLTEYQGQPFTDLDSDLFPFIGLPCRTDQPTIHAEHQYAATSAVHEGTHVFNHLLRPMHESESWLWFDEATAVFMESWVFAGNHDHLRFGMDWSDMPEVSLDDPSHLYAAGVFARYLASSEQPAFLSKVWMHPDPKLTAIEAIALCLADNGKKLGSDDPAETDVFFNQYCVDSYFLWDTASLGFLPEVYARYGERAVTESFRINVGKFKTSEYHVNHLACRYFLFDLRDDVQGLRITLTTRSLNGRTFLKASLASVKEDLGRGETWPLRPIASEADLIKLVLGPTEVRSADLDHLVLIVSNCGYRSPQVIGRQRVDNIDFQIEIEAN